MEIKQLKPRKALNKAFLKVKPNRTEIESFKGNLIQLLDRSNGTESEEFHKNLVSDFLKKTYYEPHHFINTKGRNDLVIHNGNNAKSSVGVIIEAKKPTNRSEMLSREKLNTKAFQEAVLYYLRERIAHKNLEVKHVVITNIYEWFIFDANTFEKLFTQNKVLLKQFNDFESGTLAGKTTDFFYKEIAGPFIAGIKQEIEYTYFDIRDYQNPLRNEEKKDDNKLIALFKLLSPEHLLKLPFTNDSNSLDKRFYSELLHIIGLTETKEGGKKLIGRNKEGERNAASILEDAIIQLDSLDKIGRMDSLGRFGSTQQERLFNVALELSLTWINRILFLKLLEAQLITYHKGDKSYSFLNLNKIQNYDDLNSLFFQVLARKYDERNEDVKKAFEKVPYLNSSLFEPTEMEHSALFISNLRDDKTIPIIASTVLKNEQGKKRTGNLTTIAYLFEFLNAYDFSSEGSEEIQEENKTLINASVLGLIFEKINGYKDGSFFTPGFITMYMCRETIRKAVVQKFNDYVLTPSPSPIGEGNEKNQKTQQTQKELKTLDDLYEIIGSKVTKQEANNIINSLKICDPAVGSGHFLVSALNEIIAIKSELKILQDREGKTLRDYFIEVVNDELVVTDDDGRLFEYNHNNKESQRVQETLFHEKQTLIENCLFGVDINPNSVKICRLRLWIELLKNAYYKSPPPYKGGVPERAGGISSSPDKGRWSQTGGVENIWSQTGGVNNLPYLKTFRKELRNNLTPAEAKLWTMLKGKALEGKKFRRQHSVGNYILDFYCPEEGIAIELDGQGHVEATQAEYDRERGLFLEHFGIRVLRFENKWVWDNPEGLMLEVVSWFGKGVKQPPRPADTPPLKGGELRELETLPNIDINIKCGNSLVSRFAINADLGQALKKSKWTIDSYRVAVSTYRNAGNKEQKRAMEKLIADIKSDFRSEISQNDPKVKKLRKLSGELLTLTTQTKLFEQSKTEKAAWNKQMQKLAEEARNLEAEIAAIKNNKIYENAFEWRFEFPEVLNETGEFMGFDLVIGNPPYIRQEELKEFKEYFKSTFNLYTGTSDLYIFFVEKGFDILTEGGIFNYIMPNKFMQAGYGKPARGFLLKNNLLEIVDFGDLQVFDGATTYPCILTAAKEKPTPYFNAVAIKTLDFPDGFEHYTNSISGKFEQERLTDDTWMVSNIADQQLLEKVKGQGIKLSNYLPFEGKYGIKTGLTEAFVIDAAKEESILTKNPSSKNYIHPFLLGREVKPYSSSKPSKSLIKYEKGITNKMISKVNPEEWMENNFPEIYLHLKQFKEKAERRSDKGDYYWELRACDYYGKFEKPKIMYQVFQVKPCFVFDDTGMYCNNSMWIIPTDDKVLLGILNSKLGWWLISKYCTAIQNGYQLIWKYFSQIPIAKGSISQRENIIILVDKIIGFKKQDPTADTIALEAEIDQLVYQLYDITPDEQKIIEGN